MTVLDDIRMLLHSICHAPLKNTLEEHIEYIKGVQKQACAILSVLDAASSSDRSDNMSDTMSLLSLDPSVTFEQTMTTDLDVAVLHASPFLLRLPDKRYVPLPELNIKQEQHRLHRIFADSNRALRTVHGVMSVDSLRKVLDRNVTVLHFSGHGGGANEADQDFLVFEDCNATGLGHLIDSTTLQSILCSGLPTPSLKLVFVSSCHSRQVGEVFLRAGVQHVVCVKQNEKILDEVSIIFSQAFYHAILHGKTVPQAFAIAQTRVSAETTNQYKVESGKFVLLQRCRCDALERQDDCKCVFEPLFFDVPHGKFFNLQLHNAQKKYMLPALPPIVLGREMELHTLAMLVHAPGGLVTVRGAPGIGKSTVALKVAHFMHERQVFEDGVVFCNVRGLTTVESLEASIRSTLLAEDSMNVNAPLHTLLHHTLVIIDHVDDTCRGPFRSFLVSLLSQSPRAKFVVTSTQALDMTDEKVVELHRLAPSQAARLFLKKAPRACHRLDFPEEITKPLDVELTHHPLLAYLDGHPQAIALCASLLQDKTLPELTHAICSQTTSLPPLMTSLQVAISSLSDPDTMRFFALQGYLPAGALASDYRAMFDRDWERHASVLCRYSLLQKQHHFPIKCTPRQKDIHHEALLAALQDYDKYVSGTTRTMRPAMERSRSSVEESLQKTISHAHLQSLSILFSTFPFITSYARRWVRAPDAIRWTAHFAKSMRWTHQYIGTFSSFSNAAYLILDIHEANAWNCIERYEQGSNDMPSNLPTEPTSEHESSDSPNQATPDETSTGPSGEKPPLRKKKRQPKWASATASLACYFAHTLFLAGRHEGACRAVKSGLDIAKAHGLKTVQANLTKLWATILVQEKKVEEAKVQFGLALLLYRAGDNKIGQASTLTGIGMVHSRQGNLRAAHSSFTKALALYEWSNHVLGQLNCHQRLGHLEKKLKMGDEVELTQHYAASRRLQGDLNNKKEDELVRWVGHEMSLLLEISVDITKRLPSKIRTDDGKQHDDEDVSSFARRKSYDSTRRRPIGGAKIFL
ncbi:hypothetical protein H310_09372 [Aphanomyces invadans]|uniref:AAA+ ATPase domain-containing protein n=1 Tax=Aphanomyces invadans TaxID=157072 RepID=A0A024TVR9_9STRA|nr:hypothetical protein H310_09372 [Aphanomyces invadans]ETV98089.1 hypothetical protein H310_09372 [Aphanomyces invadans]|eukprot:XP_008873650.1 hypothetical protein H310_09372 [Aphanomyces invadans]